MKKTIFIYFALLIMLAGCNVFSKMQNNSFVNAVVKVTTETALKDFFGAEYVSTKDSLKLSKQVHYKKIEKYLGESMLTSLSYKGELALVTLKNKISLSWEYDPATKNVYLVYCKTN